MCRCVGVTTVVPLAPVMNRAGRIASQAIKERERTTHQTISDQFTFRSTAVCL